MEHEIKAFHDFSHISEAYRPHIIDIAERFHLWTTIRILLVVDSFSISFTEAPSGFGVGRLVRLLRESKVGCLRFRVDLALRDGDTPNTVHNPAHNEAKYTGFRFNQLEDSAPIINNYHEVWCFGFHPGNNGSTNDANITQAGKYPTSDEELAMLTTWMNERQGGLLAMGDHHYLGASMCHRIPRIRSMRRWTNAQSVPPIGDISDPNTHLRHDTNQPLTPGEISSGDLIDFYHQEDEKPQHIDWVPWMKHRHFLHVHQRPHPILCHPKHGPIDVLPDHPHEGWCYENHEIDLSGTYAFAGVSGDEYPTVGGNQPAPTVIAHGWTTPNPPFNLAKGSSPKKRFAQISVYDGHAANVGRVATDSTWHHWFDENIYAIEHAADPENWEKISRYYLNTAVWLAPPSVHDWCVGLSTLESHFSYVGFQEYRRKASAIDLGISLHRFLAHRHGPCWVSHWLLDKIHIVDDDIWAHLKERVFGGHDPSPCLSCPPFEAIEYAALGGLVKASFSAAEEIEKMMASGKGVRFDEERYMKQQLEGVRAGLKEFRAAFAASAKYTQRLLG